MVCGCGGARDLKTHNLLLTEDGTIKLCDFGLVRCEEANLMITFHEQEAMRHMFIGAQAALALET
jgi:serine/threonine protein kinase